MNPVATKQVALDNALVAPEKRLKIEKCNARIKNLVTLASVICYLQSTQIKCISLGEYLLLLSIGASLGRQKDLIGSENQELRSCRYRALIPDDMINQDTKDSKAYKTYIDFATGKATPKKARKFKKVASPSRKLSPVLEEEPVVKPKRAKKHAKKSTIVPTTGVVIRDTPSESVPKNKTPAKVDRGKDMDLLFDVALLEATQLKKTLKKIKLETHKLHASGLGDGVGSLPKVLDDDNESWGDSGDDESNDDDSDEVTKDDDGNDVDSDADDDNEDVNVRLQATEHEEEEEKGDEEITDAGRDDSTQQKTYEKVKDDEHVIVTIVHDIQKTEVPLQSLFVLPNFANQFLNLDNIPPTETEVISMMNVKVRHEEPSTQTPPLLNIPDTVIPETSTAAGSTIPLIIPPITHLQQQSTPTPTPTPTTATTTISVPTLLEFSILFGFDQRVSALEKEISQLKQADYSSQLLKTIKSQIPTMVDAQLSIRLEDSIKKSFRSYTKEFKKKA
ncbi:hypothetical protein Tco_1314797 [Tanacetum coccineum]